MTTQVLLAIVLPTTHYSETVAFYRDILGFECREAEANRFTSCRLNNQNIMHIRAVEGENDRAPSEGGMYLQFVCSRVDEICEKLSQHRWEYKINDKKLPELEIYDPNGNLVQIKSLSPLGTKPQTNEEWQHDVFQMRYSFTASMCVQMRLCLFDLRGALRENGVMDKHIIPVQTVITKVEGLLLRCRSLIDLHKPFEESSHEDEKKTSHEVAQQICQLVDDLQGVIEQINGISGLDQAKDVHRNIGYLKGAIDELIRIANPEVKEKLI